VVVTDRDGRFAIDSPGDGGPFVFVVLPQSYWSERFYVPTADALKREVVFNLHPANAGEKYSAAYVTDIHLGEGNKEVSYQRYAATVDELNAMPDRPAFVIGGGDISLQNGQGDRYVEIMSRLRMPVRDGVGNHEMMVGQADPRARFHRLFGPTYYSFDYGRVHYVLLDGCGPSPQGEGWKNVIGLVGEAELAWLENDLRLVPEGMPTVVAIHMPLASTYPERRKTTGADAPWWLVRNRREVIDVLRKFDVPLVLQGHMHENERLFEGSIEFAETVSVSGCWWRSATGRELAVSGEPRGYRLIDVQGNRVSHRYVSSAESRVSKPGELVGITDSGTGRLEAGRDLAVNFFDASNEARVSGRFDGGPWRPWTPAKIPGGVSDLTAAHHWQCPQEQLTGGFHALEVRCRDRGRDDVIISQPVQVGSS